MNLEKNKLQKKFILLGLTIATTAAYSGRVQAGQRLEINPVIGHRDNGSNLHVFKGFGYHGDALMTQLNLTNRNLEVPSGFNRMWSAMRTEFVGGKLAEHFADPSRQGTSAQAAALASKIVKSDDHLTLNLKLNQTVTTDLPFSHCDGFSGYGVGCGVVRINENVKFKTDVLEVTFPQNGKTIRFYDLSKAPAMTEYIGGYTQGPSLILNCEFQSGYGSGGSYKSITYDLREGTFRNNRTGETGALNGSGLYFSYDDSNVGSHTVKITQKPSANPRSYYAVINGNLVANCKSDSYR